MRGKGNAVSVNPCVIIRRGSHLRKSQGMRAGAAYCGINAAAVAVWLGETESAKDFAGKASAYADGDGSYYGIETRPEAALILGRGDEAAALYRQASDTGEAEKCWADIASTRKQCRARCLLVEFAEKAGLCEEFLGGAGLDDLAVVEDMEVVAETGLPDNVVIDDDNRLPLQRAPHGVDERELLHRPHAGGWLVEEKDGGLAEQAAGECEELFLPAGQPGACGERLDERFGPMDLLSTASRPVSSAAARISSPVASGATTRMFSRTVS